jgi:hypothetical protein
MRCHRKTICVRSTPHANSPSPELALEIAPLIRSGYGAIPAKEAGLAIATVT